MLELKQMEITDYTDYEDIKQAVRRSMTKAVVSFVEIGFYLKKIKSEQLYLKDGYKDIWEAAESEFGLKRKQAWSFMSINDKYSVDGNSTELLPQYEGFSKSTLTEMLTLPEEDYELITKETKVEDIRELKQAEAEQLKEKEEEQVPGQTSIMDMMPDAVPEEDKKPGTDTKKPVPSKVDKKADVKSKKKKSLNTAYSYNMGQWMALLLMSGFVLVLTVFKKKRN